MKKTVMIEKLLCDFCLAEGKDIDAVGKSFPSEKDVCSMHQKAFLKEIRLPKEVGGDMSGFKIAIDPEVTEVKFKIVTK